MRASRFILVGAVTLDKSVHVEYHFLSSSRPFQHKLSCIWKGTNTIPMALKQTWKICDWRSSTARCGNMPIYWQHSSGKLKTADRCRLPGSLITHMKQGWTIMPRTECSIQFWRIKHISLASSSLLASCDVFLTVVNLSHRPVPEREYISRAMRFNRCIVPTVINQTCRRWLIQTYERLSMIRNPVIIMKYSHIRVGVRYPCVTTSQYFRSLAVESSIKLDALM